MNANPTEGLSKQLHVLVVTNMYPDAQHPDAGTFVHEQVSGLRARGLDIDVLVVGGKRDKLSYLHGARSFRRRMRERRYDLIHAHYVFSGVIARLQRQCPVVLSHHGIEVLQSWTAPLSWAMSRLVDQVVVMSEEMRRALGLAHAYVIPCGVDLGLFQPSYQQAARIELGLPPNSKLVLYAGLLRPEKRLDVIQAAVEILRDEDPQVELVVATGQPHERMPLYLNACDALALASDREGSPVVIKEAMACNLPIVSVDVGDVAQVIGGTDGCYICRRDPADMAQKLRLALARGQRTNGRSAVRALTLEATVDALLEVYAQTLSAGRAVRSRGKGTNAHGGVGR
jgi:teichuronic acid biosynthesis glycosyltransferase TuaC